MNIEGYHNIEDYVESRLCEWAEWFQTKNSIRIGYPSQSILQFIREGKTIKRNKRFCEVLEVNKCAEEIEALIVEMSEQNRKMADVLRKYYLGREPTLSLKAKAFGISEARFKVLLWMGRQWLAGRLSAK